MLKDEDGFGRLLGKRQFVRCGSENSCGSGSGDEETVCDEVQMDVEIDLKNECDLPPRKKTSWREKECRSVSSSCDEEKEEEEEEEEEDNSERI